MQTTKNNLPVETKAVIPSLENGIVFAPGKVIEQAHEAAKALQRVLDSKNHKVIVNGERYLEYEDWQTLARFYGYTVATGEAEEIWRENKLIGYKAHAVVYQRGQKTGGAEASCLRDETNWKNKPEFMLKSMSQTRAGAKALRNLLAWVAVLAGYKPTPAEEMTGLNGNTPEQHNGTDCPEEKTNGEKCSFCGSIGKYHKTNCPNAPKK